MTTPLPKYPSSLVTLASDSISERNLPLLLPILSPYFSHPTTKKVLELASGRGVQVSGYSKQFPLIEFYPTECDQYGVEEVNGIVSARGNVDDKVKCCEILDVMVGNDWEKLEERMGGEKFQVVVGTNFFHMIPFPEGPKNIFKQLNKVTSSDAHLLIYGPFKSTSGFFTEGDEKFDAMIKARENGSYFGLRPLEELEELCKIDGWNLIEKVDMPKGNFILIFKRS